MGLVIKLNNIISPNAFTVSYKTGPNPYPLDSGFTSYGGTYGAGTTLVVVSGITINFNSSYWFKITDNVTNRYIIENVETNDPIAYMSCCPIPVATAICYHECYPPSNVDADCIGLTPTPTATPTPTPTSTPTPTPTPTPTGSPTSTPTTTPTPTPTATATATPTPTPTPTLNIVDPEDPTVYYYYALGNCNDMRYSGTETTIFGFGAPLVIPVCMNSAQVTQWYSTANFAQQTLSIDYDNPCGFGESYSGVSIGRSTTQLTEEDVYLVDGQCLSIIAVETQYVESWSVDLDDLTPIGGDNPCGACDPPFTGYTLAGYSGVTCDTGENIIAVSILGNLVVGNEYGIQLYSGNTPMGDARCMTINANLGPQLTLTDPINNPYSGYHITDGGPFELGQPMFQGYTDCTTCNAVPKKYKIDGVRCDNSQYSVTVWSDTLPTIGINDTFRVNDSFLNTFCWKVTAKDNYKTVVYGYPEYNILDTGCSPCDGSAPITPTPTPTDGGGSGGGSGGY